MNAETKPAVKAKEPKSKSQPKADVVTLKQLCAELKLDGHEAREKRRGNCEDCN